MFGGFSTKETIEVKGDFLKKNIYTNTQLIKKISEHISFFPTAINSPEEIALEGTSNQQRNKAINKNISIVSEKYLKKIQEISTILKQRNKAIKSKANFQIWNPQLAKTATTIWEKKRSYVKEINKEMEKETQKLNLKFKATIKIEKTEKNEEEVLKKIIEAEKKDKERGHTTIGPQKDKIRYFLNEREIKSAASQGEKSIFFSILKKGEANLILKHTTKEPTILLDDIFSKLDKKNIDMVLNIFKENTQTIITHTQTIKTEHKINEININEQAS